MSSEEEGKEKSIEEYNALQIARREAAYAEWLHEQRHAIHATFDTPERALARIAAQYPLRRLGEHPWVTQNEGITEFRVEDGKPIGRSPSSGAVWVWWTREFILALAKQFKDPPPIVEDRTWHE